MSVLFAAQQRHNQAWGCNIALRLVCVVSLIFIGACGSLSPQEPAAAVTPEGREPIIALALGGGGAKGFAHVGVIKVLESHGIKPHIIVGTSAGSFVGCVYASGKSPYAVQRIAEDFEEKDIRDLTLSTQGILNGRKLQDYVNRLIDHQRIEDFPIKYAAVATRLGSGKKAVFTAGNAGFAVRASSSIPNLFIPAEAHGVKYVDGGLVSPIPVSTALDLGADIVIAVDISKRPKATEKIGLLGLFDQTLSIMGQQSIQRELAQASVVIAPEVTHFETLDLSQKHSAILEGEEAAQASIAKINQVIADFRSSQAALTPPRRPTIK